MFWLAAKTSIQSWVLMLYHYSFTYYVKCTTELTLNIGKFVVQVNNNSHQQVNNWFTVENQHSPNKQLRPYIEHNHLLTIER